MCLYLRIFVCVFLYLTHLNIFFQTKASERTRPTPTYIILYLCVEFVYFFISVFDTFEYFFLNQAVRRTRLTNRDSCIHSNIPVWIGSVRGDSPVEWQTRLVSILVQIRIRSLLRILDLDPGLWSSISSSLLFFFVSNPRVLCLCFIKLSSPQGSNWDPLYQS